MDVATRPAVPDECEAIVAMLGRLAAFEGAPTPPALTAEIARRDGFGPQRRFEAIVAESVADGALVGLMILFRGYSSWIAQPTLVVHDLYVEEAARGGGGVGRALLAAAARIAEAEGCGRLELNVLDWNERAQRFYAAAGFQPLPFWRPYRLDAAGIAALAAPASFPAGRSLSSSTP